MAYYSSSRGIEFLNKNTQFKWCTIHPSQLSSNMCAAAIAPQWVSNENYCALNSFRYVPESHRFIHQPRIFNKYLVNGKELIKFLPAVQYDLKGITINLPPIIQRRSGILTLIEGSIALEGSLLLREINGVNLTFSNSGQLNATFQKTRDDFISSFKIINHLDGSHPTLTIGSSLTDKLLMTSTNISMTPENADTLIILCSYNPQELASSYFLNSEKNLILETNMGYKFKGKLTFIHSGTGHHLLRTSAVIGGSLLAAAAIIFIIPTSGASLIGATVVAGLGL